jgi:ABC-type multidrug transport system fused ATPase/permease subunit
MAGLRQAAERCAKWRKVKRNKLMEIIVTISKEDLLTYQLYFSTQSKRIKNRRLRSWLSIPILYTLIGIFLFIIDHWLYLLLFGIIAILWLILYPFYSRWKIKRNISRYIDENNGNRMDKKEIIKLINKNLQFYDENSKLEVKITEIDKIIEISSHIFIKLKSGAFQILPKAKIEKKLLNKFVIELEKLTNSKRIEMLNWKWR